MLSMYRSQILKEIARVPEDKMPTLYQVIRLLADEFVTKPKSQGARGSLKGIWRGSQIDEPLFAEAKKSLFPYETR